MSVPTVAGTKVLWTLEPEGQCLGASPWHCLEPVSGPLSLSKHCLLGLAWARTPSPQMCLLQSFKTGKLLDRQGPGGYSGAHPISKGS